MSEGTESPGSIARVIDFLHRAEDITLALLLGLMILLAPLQLFLRNFFDTGIEWADPAIRVMVLWVGLLGAVAASRGNRHITIDVLSHLLEKRAQAGVSVITSLFTATIAGIVAYYSGSFVISELEYESMAFKGMPAWICEVIIPVAFGIIAFRYLLYTAANIRVMLAGEREAE